MPEYLAPGVFVEEVSYRAKSIEGVSTTTTGIIGPTRYGPVDEEPDVITSLGEFERTYGDRQQLAYRTPDNSRRLAPMHNYVWHAVRAFFENGGKRLYVQRVFRPLDDTGAPAGRTIELDGRQLAKDGHAFATIGQPGAEALTVSARFPGIAGRRRVRITLRVGPSVLAGKVGEPKVNGLVDRDVVWIVNLTSPAATDSPPAPPEDLAPSGTFHVARAYEDPTGARRWRFERIGDQAASLLEDYTVSADPRWSDQIHVVTATVTVFPPDPDSLEQVWSDLPLDPSHAFAGRPDSLFAKFAKHPQSTSDARTLPIVIEPGEGVASGTVLLDRLFDAAPGSPPQSPPDSLEAQLESSTSSDVGRSFDVLLDGGNDGRRPTADEYAGRADQTSTRKTGLLSLEDIEDISIVLAPGSTFGYENDYAENAATIMSLLISHAERMRYRIAVLDSGEGQSISQVRAMRATVDSKHAAFYYPWVRILDPVTQTQIHVPPSGFVAGIYARNDVNRAVYKAPANEVVTLAIGFETLLNKAQQEVLNPLGINAFRYFEGRGYRLWGARTISSDPEWKYVNLRRYFAYLERSIDVGTQWAVFEPNGPRLWANVRRTIADFLFNEFVMGAYLGDKPESSYFVKCDRSTMTQNDIDNGRLVCLIGVAVLKPAEFVIFRVGQWTADARV